MLTAVHCAAEGVATWRDCRRDAHWFDVDRITHSPLCALLRLAALFVIGFGALGCNSPPEARVAPTATSKSSVDEEALAGAEVPGVDEEAMAGAEVASGERSGNRRDAVANDRSRTALPAAAAADAVATTAVATATPSAKAQSVGPTRVVVTLGLDAARAEVESWALPGQGTEVRTAKYLRLSDLESVVAAHGADLIGPGGILVTAEGIAADGMGTVLAVVDATQDGVDLSLAERPPATAWWDPDDGPPWDLCAFAPAGTRVRFLVLFDAQTAPRWDYSVIQHSPETEWLWSALRGHESPPTVLVTPTAVELPSRAAPMARTPVPTPRGTQLAPGQVPADLLETAKLMPAVTGAWWRYRVTSVSDVVHWQRDTVTQSVSAVWWTGGDSLSVAMATGAPPHELGISSHYGSLVPNAMLADPRATGYAPPRDWLATPDPPVIEPSGAAFRRPGAPLWFFRIPPTSGTRQTYLGWTEPGLVDVNVPAGSFRGCSTLTYIINAGNFGTLWWCPQVGFVREVMPGCGSVYGGVSVYELEAWHVPEFEVVR